MESSFVHCTECKKETENSELSITHAQKVAKTSMEPKSKVQETIFFLPRKKKRYKVYNISFHILKTLQPKYSSIINSKARIAYGEYILSSTYPNHNLA